MSDKRFLVILALAILLLISVPYIIGFRIGTSSSQFGGFLINPIDGHSYLAKMQQGYRGEWNFKLPYTAEPGDGAYLFLFYLLLGHIGRITQIPLIYIFHAARLVSAGWLIFVICEMLRSLYKDGRRIKVGLALALLGSGMGWLAVLAGAFTSDLWVAEAYPFLSMYTNPHFCLGLGIMIHSLLPKQREKVLSNILSGLMLGIVQPFGVVILSLIKIVNGGLVIFRRKIDFKALIKERWILALAGFCMSGGIVIVYQFWAILSDPILAQWHNQNITVKPSVLDLLISLSPCLILGAIGARKAWKNEAGKALVLWGAVGLALVFVPWSLQRRFLTGVFFPLAALSVLGLEVLDERTPLKLRQWAIVAIFLAIPTNLVVIASGLQAMSERDPHIFLDGDLVKGLNWIETNTEEDALVLADEREGLFVPSYTGRRVVYGHPFETIQAETEREWLEMIFNQTQLDNYYEEVLTEREIDYVLLNGGEENRIGDWLQANWELTYQSNEIKIFKR